MGMRLHLNVDSELLDEVDALAGPRGRSRFIRDAIETRVEAERSRAALFEAFGAAPTFGDHLGEDWIREGRRRDTEASDRKVSEAWRRESD